MGSKKTTVGFRYYLGVQIVMCRAPVDSVRRITIGEREAWVGYAATNQSIAVDKPKLFGGDGTGGQGGVAGNIDLAFGGPAQTYNSYAAGKIGDEIPAYRKLLSATFRGIDETNSGGTPGSGWAALISAITRQANAGKAFLWASFNPYIKPVAMTVERIIQGWENEATDAWYPAKAAIPRNAGDEPVTNAMFGKESTWDYIVLPVPDVSPPINPALLSPPADGYSSGQAPFAHVTDTPIPGYEVINTLWPVDPFSFMWVKRTITCDGVNPVDLSGLLENGFLCYFDGEYIGGVNPTNVQPNPFPNFTFQIPTPTAGEHELAFYLMNEPNSIASLDYTMFWCQGSQTANAICDMNPAHIIHQLLTDKEIGLGLPTALIDDAAFTAAADTLFDEEFGLSFLWTRQEPVEDFIGVILQHINASLYQDRSTGLFVLKLIRDDYDIEDLDTFDESNILSMESFQRVAWGETVNEVVVKFIDPANEQERSVAVQNLANVQIQSGVVSSTRSYVGIHRPSLAYRVAQRDLKTGSSPLASCEIRVNRSAWAVPPGGVFKLAWSDYGITSVVFRVVEIDYGTLTDPAIRIRCVEDVFGLLSSSYAAEQPDLWTDPQQAAQDVGETRVEELMYHEVFNSADTSELDALTGDEVFIVGMAERGAASNSGYNVYLANADDVSAAEPYANGVITPTALLGGDIEPLDTEITYTGALDLLDGVWAESYAYIDNELVWIESMTGGDMTVRRGIYDTVPVAHAAGARIWIWNGENGATESGGGQVEDEEVFVWFPAMSVGDEQDLAEADQETYTGTARWNRPWPPANVMIAGEYFPTTITTSFEVSWVGRNKLQQTTVGEAGAIAWVEANIDPEVGTTYTLALRDGATDDLLDAYTGLTLADSPYLIANPFVYGVSSMKVELFSVLDGRESHQMFSHLITLLASGLRVTEDDEDREVEGGGEIRETETSSSATEGGGGETGTDEGALVPLAWDGSQFVAVRLATDIESGVQTSHVWTSPDGTSWTKRTPDIGFTPESMVFASGRYVAIGGSGYFGTVTDLDDPWTTQQITAWPDRGVGGGVAFSEVIHDGTQFVACGAHGLVVVSTDGENWTEVGTEDIPFAHLVRSIAYNGTTYIIDSGNASDLGDYFSSTDLETWTAESYTPAAPNDGYAGKWRVCNGKFILCGGKVSGGANVPVVMDGNTADTFTERSFVTSGSLSKSANEATYFASKYIVAGTNCNAYSSNLVTWTVQNQSSRVVRSNLVNSGDELVAIEYRGTSIVTTALVRTTDGVTWTDVTL